jgi:hypothetical protein
VQERVSHDPDVLGVVRGHPRGHELDMAILLLAGIPLCVRESFVLMTAAAWLTTHRPLRLSPLSAFRTTTVYGAPFCLYVSSSFSWASHGWSSICTLCQTARLEVPSTAYIRDLRVRTSPCLHVRHYQPEAVHDVADQHEEAQAAPHDAADGNAAPEAAEPEGRFSPLSPHIRFGPSLIIPWCRTCGPRPA